MQPTSYALGTRSPSANFNTETQAAELNHRTPGPEALPATETALIRAHVHAAVVTVLISALFGLLVSVKLHTPFGGDAWSTWGRLRYNHTQGIFFGWLGNAFLAFCYFVVPRLTNRPVSSRKLGWVLFAVWNFAVVLPGWTLVLMGFSQPLEWAEFPLIVDLFVVLAFILSIWQFAAPVLKMGLADIYVSGWYLIGGLIFTALAYPSAIWFLSSFPERWELPSVGCGFMTRWDCSSRRWL